jgi:hypothetical protein
MKKKWVINQLANKVTTLGAQNFSFAERPRSFGGQYGLHTELAQGSANRLVPLECNVLLSGSSVGSSNGENLQTTPLFYPQ